jgi:hypothetical protein
MKTYQVQVTITTPSLDDVADILHYVAHSFTSGHVTPAVGSSRHETIEGKLNATIETRVREIVG